MGMVPPIISTTWGPAVAAVTGTVVDVVGALVMGGAVVVVTCSAVWVNAFWLVGGAEVSSAAWPQPTTNKPANSVQDISKMRDMTRKFP